MFKTNDELKAMKQKHEDVKTCLEATEAHVDNMLLLRNDNGSGPPRLPSGPASAASRPKTSAPRDPAVHAPTTRVTGGAGGYPSAKGRSIQSAPSGAASRQAQIASTVLADLEADLAAAGAEAARAARLALAPRVTQEDAKTSVVLSYSCICRAVAEELRISLDKARDMAESSSEFRRHLSFEQWEAVKERSLALEKAQKDQQRQKEQRKQEAAVARITDKQGPPLSAAPPPSNRPAPSAAVAKTAAKAAVKPKLAPKIVGAPKKAALSNLAQANRFGGLSDSDDDEDGGGWSTVRR